jgi:hypothetical protein
MNEHWIDRAWKDCITENVDDAILFFKPDLAADRDYSRKPMLVPNELPAIGSDSDKGMRISDIASVYSTQNRIRPKDSVSYRAATRA